MGTKKSLVYMILKIVKKNVLGSPTPNHTHVLILYPGIMLILRFDDFGAQFSPLSSLPLQFLGTLMVLLGRQPLTIPKI